MSSKEKLNRITAVHPRVFPRLVTSSIGLAVTFALAALIMPIWLTGAFAQDTLTTTVTIDSAELNSDGTVTVTYTVECSEDATILQQFVAVQQSVGRFGVRGVSGEDFSSENVPCDENGVQLTQTVIASSGFFAPGRATVRVDAYACPAEGSCDSDQASEVVRLSR
jgi:hypothetical protein